MVVPVVEVAAVGVAGSGVRGGARCGARGARSCQEAARCVCSTSWRGVRAFVCTSRTSVVASAQLFPICITCP